MSFVAKTFKLFGSFDIKMGFLCLICGTIKEKLRLDPRKRIRACQLTGGQRFFCQNSNNQVILQFCEKIKDLYMHFKTVYY